MTDPITERQISGRIVIVVDLPQSLDKIGKLMETLGTLWPGSSVNANPPRTTIAVLGGSIVEIPCE